MSPEQARWLVYQLFEGLEFIHSAHVYHRDLKPANLLVSEPDDAGMRTLKLCDFGQAAMISGGEGRRLRRKCGTEQYMAPEVLDAELGGALGCERTQPPTALSGQLFPLLVVRSSILCNLPL